MTIRVKITNEDSRPSSVVVVQPVLGEDVTQEIGTRLSIPAGEHASFYVWGDQSLVVREG